MDVTARIVSLVRESLPQAYAIYLFGSRATGQSGAGSDVDVAVVQPARIDPILRWTIANKLAAELCKDVDLIDLQAASSVMRAQVLATATLLHDGRPTDRALFEATALADYARLNEERRGILDDVRRRGTIYG